MSDSPTGFVWVETGSLAGSGYPASRGQVGWLVKRGIGSILTLTEEPLPGAWTSGFALDLGHVPIHDHQSPDADSMEKAVEYILSRRKEGKAVLVHCLAGEGRTGCVLAAYLIRTRHMGADEAMGTLRSLKQEFIEHGQEGAVRGFASGEAWRLVRPPNAHGPDDLPLQGDRLPGSHPGSRFVPWRPAPRGGRRA